MAIGYTLEIDTSWSAAAVAAEVLALGRAAGIVSGSDGADALPADLETRSGTWVRVQPDAEKPEPWASWDPVATTFGLRSTVSISFRLGKSDDLVPQDDDVIRLVTKLLDRVPGDLILWIPESDLVWLLRRGHQLVLSDQDDLWPPHRLNLVTQPYRRVPLAFDESS